MSLPSFALLLSLFAPSWARAQVPVFQEVSSQEIVACAETLLAARASALEGKVDWSLASSPSASRIPVGMYRLQVGEVIGKWPRRRVGVPVQVWVGDQVVQSRLVWFTVHWWKQALVYARAAAIGEPAIPELVRMQTVDALEKGGLATGDIHWMEGMRLRRLVRADEVVRQSDFEPAPIVARNDSVRVQVWVGGVRLLTSGIARQQGGLNEEIDVRPAGSAHSVKARVVARNEVRIER